MAASPNSRLAVLITYYNEGNLLSRCLRSLAKQTRPVDEIVVYDDASDIPPESHIPAGMQVHVVRGEKNVGPAKARNALLQNTEGSIIHFHDSDDEFMPTWCERVRTAFEEGTADIVFTEVTFVHEDGKRIERLLHLDRVVRGEDLTRFCIRGAMVTSTGTYRRDVIVGMGGYRGDLWQAEDWDFHIRLSAQDLRVHVLDEPLVIMHGRLESRSRNVTEVWSSAVRAIELLASEIPARYTPDLSNAAARAGSTLFQAGAVGEARRAFRLARRLGRPALLDRPALYRYVTRLAGQESAERASQVYRRLFPAAVRSLLHPSNAD